MKGTIEERDRKVEGRKIGNCREFESLLMCKLEQSRRGKVEGNRKREFDSSTERAADSRDSSSLRSVAYDDLREEAKLKSREICESPLGESRNGQLVFSSSGKSRAY